MDILKGLIHQEKNIVRYHKGDVVVAKTGIYYCKYKVVEGYIYDNLHEDELLEIRL